MVGQKHIISLLKINVILEEIEQIICPKFIATHTLLNNKILLHYMYFLYKGCVIYDQSK